MTASGFPLAGRIGIFQGRLVPSTNGELQCHPGDRWAEELRLAGQIGLAHVELLAEREWSAANPVWSAAGRAALTGAARDAGVGLVSLCCEEVLDRSIADPGGAAELAGRLASVAGGLGLAVVVLPMFEASDPGGQPWDALVAGVATVSAALRPHATRVVLELPLPADDCLRFLADTPAVGLCYDTGNATAMGMVPAHEIPVLGSRVWHVHAKDKDASGANVRFGTGRVDFPAAFAALGATRYGGRVTIEATRGDDPVVTASAHLAFLEALAPGPGAGSGA